MYGVVGRERHAHAGLARAGAQRLEQPDDAALVALLQHVVERLEPLAGFDRFESRGIGGREILHDEAVLR